MNAMLVQPDKISSSLIFMSRPVSLYTSVIPFYSISMQKHFLPYQSIIFVYRKSVGLLNISGRVWKEVGFFLEGKEKFGLSL